MIDVQALAPLLVRGPDGIWYGDKEEELSYPADGNQACFELEDSSFWFEHRNACIAAAVSAFPPSGSGTIFDVGGGNGFVSAGLMRAGFDVVLVEPGHIGAANAKKRGISTVICATIGGAGFKHGSLDAIGLFDVVEHIEDVKPFLELVRSLLKPSGRIYLTVPSYPFLWSKEDEIAGHYRRYSLKAVEAEVTAAAFKLDYSTYIFRPLPLPIFLLRSAPFRLGLSKAPDGSRHAKDHQLRGTASANLMRWLLCGEIRNIAERKTMAFGGSCLLVGRAL